jgi:hypothetical protein
MTLGEQNTRWLTLHSQLLPYMTAVPAKDPPASAMKSESHTNRQQSAPVFGQIPVFNSPPQPLKHEQYDAVHKRIDMAYKQALVWQDVKTES